MSSCSVQAPDATSFQPRASSGSRLSLQTVGSSFSGFPKCLIGKGYMD